MRPFSFFPSLVGFVAPALLIVVGTRQLILAHTHNLTPWKGGGFGMFSSVDHLGRRIVRCYLQTSTGETLLRQEDLGKLLRDSTEVAAIPTEANVASFARRLANVKWAVVANAGTERGTVDSLTGGDSAANGSGDANQSATAGLPRAYRLTPVVGTMSSSGKLIAVIGARVEVWRIRFDPAGARIIPIQLASAVAVHGQSRADHE